MAGAAWGPSVWEPPDASRPPSSPKAAHGAGEPGPRDSRSDAAESCSGAAWLAVRAHTGCAAGPAGTAPRHAGGRANEATLPARARGEEAASPKAPRCPALACVSTDAPGLDHCRETTVGAEPSPGPPTWVWEAKGETFGGKQICSISVAARGAVRALPPNTPMQSRAGISREHASPGLHTDGRLLEWPGPRSHC